MFDLSIHATDASDLYRQIRDLAGPAMLEGYPDEALLTEVRQRMAKKGFVVVIRPFESETAGADEATTGGEPSPPDAPKGKPGRKPTTKAPEATKTIEAPKPVEPASDTAKAMAEQGEAVLVDLNAVKAALDAYAAVHGQMPARAIMQTVGGHARLMDIPVEKYIAVVRALAVKVAA